jgi:hypothetical protein
MDEAAALEAVADVLTSIAENPYDLSLHIKHIRLAEENDMADQLVAAREMLTDTWACADNIWLPILESRKQAEDVASPDGAQRVLELYARAEQDYLCALYST